MMLPYTILATGIPSRKVKYSRFSSIDDGYIDLQVDLDLNHYSSTLYDFGKIRRQGNVGGKTLTVFLVFRLLLCQCVMMPSRTNLATGIPSSKVKYSRLSSTDDGYIDLQFKKSPPKIPYKAIALATVLFLIGTFLIIIGSLLLAGYISKGQQQTSPTVALRWVVAGADRAVPVLIIGILVFLPGFYHLRIAYYASKGYRGYSYDDIPDFDD
ncbi:hypothetical protein QTO34_001915 [Cnephaeus nilssonii]|uniref:Transmembrane protein 230 n=1 Tax=Cnephaeus nilssonii TaxID=3371016 RepID=A0AA40LMX6_CNENI|nr:hypothetical protein QTO34_001915 [Eptesicus nilssonii]